MPTPGRNDPCPCGSGKKYKRCCLERDPAATCATPAAKPTEREASAAERRARAEELRDTLDEARELDHASNAVMDLIDAGRLDEAEHAAKELLVHYPDLHDGHDRLGMVYEARGLKREAADSYRKVIDIMRAHPGNHDPEMQQHYLEMITNLDPPPN